MACRMRSASSGAKLTPATSEPSAVTFSVRIGAKRSWIRPLKTSLPVTTMPALARRSARTDSTPPF